MSQAEDRITAPVECPKCQTIMNVMLFMGKLPDGYVCPKCRIYFAPVEDDQPPKPLAIII